MPYQGKTTRKGTCAICRKGIAVGEIVYFDAKKAQGSHLVHVVCWDVLRAERVANGTLVKPVKGPIVSTEPLDPPF